MYTILKRIKLLSSRCLGSALESNPYLEAKELVKSNFVVFAAYQTQCCFVPRPTYRSTTALAIISPVWLYGFSNKS